MSSSADEDVSVLEGPSELIGGVELDGVAVAVKVDREQIYEDDLIPLLASDLSREIAVELEAVERGEEQPELVTDGGLPWDEDDIQVRRARLEPGLGGEDDDEPETVTDGGRPVYKGEVEYPGANTRSTVHVRAENQSAAHRAIEREYDGGYVSVLYELADPDAIDDSGIIDAGESRILTDGGRIVHPYKCHHKWRSRLFDDVDCDLQDDELDETIDAEELVSELEAQADLETDGGRPAALEDAHDRALEILEQPGEHLPDDVLEELEALGIDPEDIDSSLGGVRGGLWREDVGAVVAKLLERNDIPLEITARQSEDGYHWEVEWVRDEAVEYPRDEEPEFRSGGELG